MSTVGLRGKVARILNERELAINVGQKDGVTRGMKFAVLAETPTEIIDSDTQEVLGVVDREKVRVQAVEVNERFSICSTYEKRIVGGRGPADAILQGALREWIEPRREIVRTLEARDDDRLPPLSNYLRPA